MDHMLLLFIGPPGSGKGTQAKRLVEHFCFDHISTGDILRSVPATTPLGRQVAQLLNAGQFVPDELVTELVKDKLVRSNGHAGVILDGFPRNTSQICAFENILATEHTGLNAAIHIQVPDALLIQRMAGRRHDPQTGQIYNLNQAENAPPAQITDRLEQREDDTEEAIRKRLSIYHHNTAPVISHYAQRDLLIPVDGTPKPDEVFFSILHHIETLN
jgi:adenylate kinase